MSSAAASFAAIFDTVIPEYFPITGRDFYNNPDEATKIVRYLATQATEVQKAFCEVVAELYKGSTLVNTLFCLFFAPEQRGKVLAHAICLAAYTLICRDPDAKRRLDEKYSGVIELHEQALEGAREELGGEPSAEGLVKETAARYGLKPGQIRVGGKGKVEVTTAAAGKILNMLPSSVRRRARPPYNDIEGEQQGRDLWLYLESVLAYKGTRRPAGKPGRAHSATI